MRCKFFLWLYGMEHDKALATDEPIEGLPERLEIRDEADARAWSAIPKRAAQVLAMYKIGFTTSDIAAAFDIDRASVKAIRSKYDPAGVLRLPPSAGKAIIAAQWTATAARAIAGITPDKLAGASAAALATVAGIATDKALKLQESIAADNVRDDVATLAGSLRAQLGPQAPAIAED